MRIIVCNIGLFELKQKIYILDTTTGMATCVATVSLGELPKTVAALCVDKNIDVVRLKGSSFFVKKIKKDIVNNSNMLYNNNRIKVEII